MRGGLVRVGMLNLRRLMTAMVAATALAACSGGDDGGTTNPTPAISITLSSATVSVTQGQTNTVTVNLTRSGGFTGDVALTLEGFAGTLGTSTFAPATIGASASSAVLTIGAAATAAPGVINATVRATGTGVTAVTATLAITIVAAPTPSFTLALSPTTLSIAQGGNGTTTVTVTPAGGFTGAVALTAENLPTGVTAAFNPASASEAAAGAAATSTLTLTASATAATGTTNITVRGTGTGVTAQTATLALTVTVPVPAGFTLAMSPTTLTISQGANGTSTVTITRTGGFTGSVNLTASGLPTGVTAAFNPTDATGNTSTLTLTASATAATGTVTVTIKGTSAGQTDRTTTLSLTVNAVGGFTLSMNPTTLSIAQGANGTSTVNITRTGSFAGSVNLTASGLPTGVTAAFNPTDATGNTSTLTLTASATAATGAATVTIKGTATGQTDQTTTLSLTVTAAGGYTLSLTPATLSVAQGANGTTTVNITRTNGFTGTVNLTATGLPTGVTAAFNPAAATGNTSTLTLTASATAATGAATVVIHGNSGALAEQTTNLSLTVTATGGGSGNTTWEFCTAANTPIWFAIQDGANGTWTRILPSASGTKFQFNITQAKGGIAYVIQSGTPFTGSTSRTFAARLTAQLQQELLMRNRPTRANAYAASSLVLNYALTIGYGTQAELNGTGTSRCLPGTGKTVNGSVANVSATQSATVSLGSAVGSANGTAPPTSLNFVLTNVPDGALDLIAGRTTTTISGTDFSIALDKVIIRRGVTAANNSTLPVLDFGAAEAFDPVQANLTIGNLGTDVAFATSSYFTAAGSGIGGAALSSFSLPGTGPFKYYGIPTAKQAAGDLHVAVAFALPSLQSSDQSRFAALYFKDPTDRTVTLGAALTVPTLSTAATAPYVRFRATGPIQTEYNQFLQVGWTQQSTARQVSIFASQAYLAGLTNYDFTVPDFTAVAGWDNNWGPKVGAATNWSATGYAISGIGFGTGTPLEGSSYKGAVRQGSVTP